MGYTRMNGANQVLFKRYHALLCLLYETTDCWNAVAKLYLLVGCLTYLPTYMALSNVYARMTCTISGSPGDEGGSRKKCENQSKEMTRTRKLAGSHQRRNFLWPLKKTVSLIFKVFLQLSQRASNWDNATVLGTRLNPILILTCTTKLSISLGLSVIWLHLKNFWGGKPPVSPLWE